jgi:flagellar biosynthesis chaperone FliJ
MKLTHTLKKTTSSKRLVIIIGSALLLVVLIVGYGVWSSVTWSNYDKTYENWSVAAKKDLATSIQAKVSNDQQRLKKISQIRETVQGLDQSARTICQTNSLVNWQSFLGDLKKKQEECRKHQEKVTVFVEKMRPILTYLDDEQKVTKVLAGVPKNTEQLDEKTWEAQVAPLQNVLKAADGISVSSEALPLKEATQATLKENIAAWQELIAAHQAKDRSRYENAQVRLVKSYSSYGGLATISADQIGKLVKALPTL